MSKNPSDSLSDRLRQTKLNYDEEKDDGPNVNKPDFKELDLMGSPISPLRTRTGTNPTTTTTTTTSSSSSSSGSVSGRTTQQRRSDSSNPNSHSGELSSDSSPSLTRVSKPGHTRSESCGSHRAGSGSVTSPSAAAAGNVMPAGNICPSGRVVVRTDMASRSTRSDVLGSGAVNYGHGSIMRGASGSGGSKSPVSYAKGLMVGGGRNVGVSSNDPEEMKRLGNECYKKGQFTDALRYYEKAIAIAPRNAACHFNRSAALMSLGRLVESVMECEEAIRLDPGYVRAHQRLGSLFLSLGHVDCAKKQILFPGHQPDPVDVQKLHAVEKHMSKCTDARRVGDWRSILREVDAAIAAGADASPQLFASRAEALLKLNQPDEAFLALSYIPQSELSTISLSHSKIFGILVEAYMFFVRAQVDLARGRFDSAVTAIEKAGKMDPHSLEISILLNKVTLAGRSRARGNDLFKSERFTEACAAYSEGLRLDASNSVLYCNRAACWFKLGQWEKSVDDCNQALRIQPNYMKALLRRAASNSKLERWSEAVTDYEILRRELPDDNDIAESLFHSQVALKKSRGEEVYNMKFGGEVESVSGLEQFRAAISTPGTSVVHFYLRSDIQCKQISPFLDTLCTKYPSINFLKVDIEESSAIAQAENVGIVPTFKIYRKGSRVKEMVCPSPAVLESSVRHYNSI